MSCIRKKSYCLFHFGIAVFLYIFSQKILLSEGLECYYCTDFPKSPGYYDGCGEKSTLDPKLNSTTTIGLLHECRLLNISSSSIGDGIEGFEGVFHRPRDSENKSSAQLTVPSKSKPVISIESKGWLCAKVVATIKLNKDKAPKNYVLRGCVYAAAETNSNRCEDIDNRYTFANVSVSNAKICFCKGNGCNSGKILGSAKSAIVGLLLLQVWNLYSI